MRVLFAILLSIAVAPILGAQPSERINEDALEDLRIAAEEAHSDAVLVLHDGEPIAEWYFGEERSPIELMSVVKSVVALGIGRLLELGAIDSLDQPVHAFYPEWNQGRKKEITIRHLLNHTSGIQNEPKTKVEIYPSPDAVQLSLAAELTEDSGSTFRYNNKAVNLLSGIIEEAAEVRMDQFFLYTLFRPMGIGQYRWFYDRSGRPHAMAGLALNARDLAKFGQLVLNGGVWEGERLISEAFIEEMLAQGQPYYPLCGLLWWRLPNEHRAVLDERRMAEFEETGISADVLNQLRPLVGSTFTTTADREAALEEVFGPDWFDVVQEIFWAEGLFSPFRAEFDEIIGFYGIGSYGQYLVFIPERKIIAIRQVRPDDEYNAETDGLSNFPELVLGLIAE